MDILQEDCQLTVKGKNIKVRTLENILIFVTYCLRFESKLSDEFVVDPLTHIFFRRFTKMIIPKPIFIFWAC